MSCDRCGTRYAKKMMGSRKVYNIIDPSEVVCSGLMLFWGSYSQSQRSKSMVIKNKSRLRINGYIMARDRDRDNDGCKSQKANSDPQQGAFFCIRRGQGESKQWPDVAVGIDGEGAQ